MNGLHFLRLQCDMSEEMLAKKINVETSNIKKWENNEQEIPTDIKEILSQLFGVDKSMLSEISEKQKLDLYNTPMFIYGTAEDKYYSYQIPNDFKSGEIRILFRNEQREFSKRKVEEANEKVQNIISKIDKLLKNPSGNIRTIASQLTDINWACNAFSTFTENYSKIFNMKNQSLDALMRMLLDNYLDTFGEIIELIDTLSVEKSANSKVDYRAFLSAMRELEKFKLGLIKDFICFGCPPERIKTYKTHIETNFASLEDALKSGIEFFKSISAKDKWLNEYSYTATIK